MTRVPVTVLTGFLGAGKTTLLRSLLTQTDGRRIAVIVNEFGDAGFDGGLVEECAAKACAPGDIVELTNGCICCTVADDFIPTMDKLLARDRPLDAIVIEERAPLEVGRETTRYTDKTTATAIAMEILRSGLGMLASHWGVKNR